MNDTEKLTLIAGLSIGMSSIIGSGLFFLPVLTARTTGTNPVLPWILVAGICLPFVRVFYKITTRHPSSTGIVDAVYRSFGTTVGRFTAYLTLFSTSFGMPIASSVAGDYLALLMPFLPGGDSIGWTIISLAWVQCFLGFHLAKSVQTTLVAAAGVALFLFAMLRMESTMQVPIRWRSGDFIDGFSAAPIAFWAYAGWENLSFLSFRLTNPARQLPIILIATLIVATGAYGLFSAIAAAEWRANPEANVQSFAGFYSAESPHMLLHALAASAVLLIWANLSAWMLGLSDLCGHLLTNASGRGGQRTLALLGLGYFIGFCTIWLAPSQREFLVRGVSCGFLMIYLLALAAFLRYPLGIWDRALASLAFLATLVYFALFTTAILFPAVALSTFVFLNRSGVFRSQTD